jgi:hypothetical protein
MLTRFCTGLLAVQHFVLTYFTQQHFTTLIIYPHKLNPNGIIIKHFLFKRNIHLTQVHVSLKTNEQTPMQLCIYDQITGEIHVTI